MDGWMDGWMDGYYDAAGCWKRRTDVRTAIYRKILMVEIICGGESLKRSRLHENAVASIHVSIYAMLHTQLGKTRSRRLKSPTTGRTRPVSHR